MLWLSMIRVIEICGPRRIRTADLRNANAALYQLSYRPICPSIYGFSVLFPAAAHGNPSHSRAIATSCPVTPPAECVLNLNVTLS